MFQQVILIGNLGKDPEVLNFNNGQSITKFSLATSKSWKNDQGEKQSKSTWHDVVVRGGQQNYVQQYLKKGDQVQVIGEIDVTSKDDGNGNKRNYTSISAQRIQSMGSGNRGSNQGGSNQTASQQGYMPQPQQPQQPPAPQQYAQQPQQPPAPQQPPPAAAPQAQYAPANYAQQPPMTAQAPSGGAPLTEDGIPF